MKRKILYVFAMPLWFLIFSTLFSFKVEQIMVPTVTESIPAVTPPSAEATLDLDCLFLDDDGVPVLYQTYEGLAWDSGLRIKLIGPASYNILDDHISCGALERVVRYATKDPIVGERVIVTDQSDKRDDFYLAVCPSGVRLREDLNVNLAAQAKNVLLAEVEQAPSAFMPKQAVSMLFQRQPYEFPDERVYSLQDVEVFFSALPLVALLPGIIVFVTLLWLNSYKLLSDLKKNRVNIIINGCLALSCLLSLAILLHFLQLPSSLLPKDSVVNISYYVREFEEVLSSLHLLAESGVPMAEEAISHAYTSFGAAAGVVLFCALLAIFVPTLEKRPLLSHMAGDNKEKAK